jgi:hypothetical protein
MKHFAFIVTLLIAGPYGNTFNCWVFVPAAITPDASGCPR